MSHPLYEPLQPTVLIEAGAGTGKTYTIAGLYIRLLLERGLTVDQILVVTFTKAATEELKTRIRTNIATTLDVLSGGDTEEEFFRWIAGTVPPHRGVPLLRRALADFDMNAVFTIHGFCQRILTEHAFLSAAPFTPEILPDQHDLIMEILRDFWRREVYQASPLFLQYLRAVKASPESLAKMVLPGLNHPTVRIVPEPQEVQTRTQEEAFLTAWQQVREAWPRCRVELHLIFTQCDGLNRNKYRTSAIPGLLESMQNLLDASPCVELFKGFERFTGEYLKTSLKKGFDPPACDFFALCDRLQESAAVVKESFDRRYSALCAQGFSTLRRELGRRKQAQGQLSYDDLLLSAHKALSGTDGSLLRGRIRDRIHAALIDEFQDTDPLQYEIFKGLFQGPDRILFLIGDPKQAIYSFRGADLFAYLQASRDCSEKRNLATNFRSRPPLLQAVNTLFSCRSAPFLLPEIDYVPVQAPPVRAESPQERDGSPALKLAFLSPRSDARYLNKEEGTAQAARVVTAEIATLIADNRYSAGEMAVLVRTNHEARLMRESLAAVNIPAVLTSVGSVFQTPEAEDLALVLQAVLEPGAQSRARSALCTDMLRTNPATLDVHAKDQEHLSGFQERLYGYHRIWADKGFVQMFQALLHNEAVLPRLLSRSSGERKMTNLLHLMELLHMQGSDRSGGMSGLLKVLVERVNSEESTTADEHQLRLESDRFAVTIMTVHRSKGLEFPVVFCPFLFSGSREPKNPPVLFHHPEDGTLTMDIGSREFHRSRQESLREILAEDLRLLYVALTRAEKHCFVVWGAVSGVGRSALAYLISNETGPETDVDVMRQQFESQSGETLLSLLHRMDSASPEGLHVEPVSTVPVPAPIPSAAGTRTELRAENFSREIDASFKVTSFTGLTTASDHPQPGMGDETVLPGSSQDMPGEGNTLADFPRGAGPGIFFHSLLEETDFTETQSKATTALVRDKLTQFGFESDWEPAVCTMLRHLADITLDPETGLSLSMIGQSQRLNELEFFHPLGRISPQDLSRVFALAGKEHASFAERLGRLTFSPRQGFMRGFIDLVFTYGDRYYLVDWKSNWLGPGPADYGPKQLQASMEGGWYILQYHLYTLALNRYLTRRVAGYDYAARFGGVFYVYLRGVDPGLGPQFGIYRDCPAPGLIEELERRVMG